MTDDEVRNLSDDMRRDEADRERTALGPSDETACSVALRVAGMDKLAIHEAIEATHPCRMETPESYQADALAMELIHKRHDKREIVNLIRWCLMGCPPNDKDLARRALDSE